jgi:tetratricopeptide (TPR) repeat protein
MPKPSNVFRTIEVASLALLACCLAAGCGSSRGHVREEARWSVDHGDFDEAVRMAAKAAEENPDDPVLQQLHRDASVAWLLDQGRRATFADDDDEALRLFNHALELDPQSAEAQDWLAKTNRKLATRWLEIALELHAKDDIEAALTAYEHALEYMPADKDALTGRGLSLLILNHREGLGRKYFNEGLHALADYWLEQARSRFAYSRKYQPEDTRTRDRKKQVDTLLAVQRLALGREFENKLKFGAARNEYRIALLLDPASEDAKAGLVRSNIEMEVRRKLETAGMDIVRGRYDHATRLVEEATALTSQQKDMCDGKLAAIREARFEKAYREALALERDYQYEEAVKKYGELLAQADFYKDVITRKDTLEEYMRLATDLYARAQAESDATKKLELLRQISVFWPEYKDVAAQIKALETQPPGG